MLVKLCQLFSSVLNTATRQTLFRLKTKCITVALFQIRMYLKSSSEPPEPLESKNGLRGGFPIKINGQALGSQESLQDFGTSDNSGKSLKSCAFGIQILVDKGGGEYWGLFSHFLKPWFSL